MSMEGRSRGLGRGLSALLGEAAEATTQPAGVREIPIELIRPNPDQPRSHFDEDELEGLAQSLRQKGMLQPVLVRPSRHIDGEYQIVAGERRWRAAQKAGFAAIPALVRQLGDHETLEIALIENVQRTDLNPLEEASAYMALLGLTQRTQEELAQVVGKSRSHVANAMRLLQLPDPVQALVRAGRLSPGHARAILGAPDVEALARRIVDENLNVRDAEALGRAAHEGGEAPPSPPRSAGRKSADTLALERDLSERLGLKVEIADKDGKGEVRIKYRTLEQLDDLLRRLGGVS